jgi:hypothetical protein
MVKKTDEILVLLNFLKSGKSTRQLDKLLNYSDKKGWISWDILKRYGLRDSDKGKLFLYSASQSKKIIKLIIQKKREGHIDNIIKEFPPTKLDKYKNTYVVADSEKSFYNILSGETRNIIRDFFIPEKKLIGKCQFEECNYGGQIDTVHFSKNRPQIFIECARKNKRRLKDGMFYFDVYNTMKCFLQSHSNNKSICFLCKKHHNEFHREEKKGKNQLKRLKSKIIFN